MLILEREKWQKKLFLNRRASCEKRLMQAPSSPQKLFLIHCGYYDAEVGGGLFESHVNYFVVAESVEMARERAKTIAELRAKRMHIDGIQEISAVGGYRILLQEDASLGGETKLVNFNFRELAPKKN